MGARGSGLAGKENFKNCRAKARCYRIISLSPNPRAALRATSRKYVCLDRQSCHFLVRARQIVRLFRKRKILAKISEYPGTAARPRAHASGPAPRSDGARETLFPD
jgi:hypothetical protein